MDQVVVMCKVCQNTYQLKMSSNELCIVLICKKNSIRFFTGKKFENGKKK